MIKITNIRDRGMLGIKGKRLEPGQSADIDTSHKDLKNHPFVLEGWLQIETELQKKTKPQNTKQSKETQEEVSTLSESGTENAGSKQ